MFSIDGSCKDCLNIFTAYQDGVLSEASLEEQMSLAIAFVCPTVDNPRDCEYLVVYYWPYLGNIFFYNTK